MYWNIGDTMGIILYRYSGAVIFSKHINSMLLVYSIFIELNKLVIKAEKKRAMMDSKKQKLRIEKSPSMCSKPINAPKWTFNDTCAVEPLEYTSGIADTVIERSTANTASTTASTTASSTASITAATTPRRIISNPPARQVFDLLENNYEDTSSDYSSESDSD